MPNLFAPDFDELREHPGFACRRARIGRQAGSARIGASVWEIPTGQSAYPYHYHLGEEELLLVLSGTLELRTPQGRRQLAEGEVVSFEVGERGAHQITNRGSGTARMLAISTSGAPDLVIYPESRKVGAFERLPQGGGLYALFKLEDAVDYWEGEGPPS